MPVTAQVPFGIDDLAVYTLSSTDVVGTKVDVPGSRTLEFTLEFDTEELRGDNQLLHTQSFGKRVTGSLEAAQYDTSALAAITGAAVPALTGTTPNQILTYTEPSAIANRYVQIVGQATAVDGGAFRVTIFKAKLTGGPSINMAEGSFSTPTLDFTGVAKAGNLFRIEQYETGVAIA